MSDITSWTQLRELVMPSVDAFPAPPETKAALTIAMTELVDECEAMQDRLDRIEAWAKANTYRREPDWYGLDAILHDPTGDAS